jgi:hypothetical protein
MLEGLRYSIEIIDLAHERLRASAVDANAALDASRPPERRLFTAAFSDAWSIIDWTNRLRTLLANFGYRADRNPVVRSILDDGDGDEGFRNAGGSP